jgi:hypothetical protein
LNKELSISIDELRKKKVFIATPMYGGMCSGFYTKSLIDLTLLCTQYQIQFQTHFLYNESLITRARNYLTDEFLRSDCTHLMFIDSDIVFNAKDVFALLHLCEGEKNIVCGPYPKKSISWEKIKAAVDKSLADKDPDILSQFAGDFVFNIAGGNGTKVDLMLPFEVTESGTGFMMIERSVFEKYAKAHPELSYLPDHKRSQNFDGSKEITAFFMDPLVNKRHLSEDYNFCYTARELGLKVWLCPWMQIHHIGTYAFEGNLPAIISHGLSPTVDVQEIERLETKWKGPGKGPAA